MSSQINLIVSNFNLATEQHFSVTTKIDYSPDIKVYELVPALPGDKFAMIKADYIYNDTEAIKIISEIFDTKDIELIPPRDGVQDKGDEGTLSAYFDRSNSGSHNVYILAKYR